MRAATLRSPSAACDRSRRSRRRTSPFAKITMRAGGATGWTVSSTAPVHRYGGALETESKTSIRKARQVVFFYNQHLICVAKKNKNTTDIVELFFFQNHQTLSLITPKSKAPPGRGVSYFKKKKPARL